MYRKKVDEDRVQRTADLFSCLTDSTRLRLLLLLTEQAEMTPTQLQEYLGVSQPGISHHLATLQRNGIVDCRRDGRFSHYWLRSKYVRSVLHDLKLGVIQ